MMYYLVLMVVQSAILSVQYIHQLQKETHTRLEIWTAFTFLFFIVIMFHSTVDTGTLSCI